MATLRWQLLPGQKLTHRYWDDEYLVFNNLSGDTHLLDAAAFSLLLDLRDAPIDSTEIDDNSAQAADGVRDSLRMLVALGLVEVQQ